MHTISFTTWNRVRLFHLAMQAALLVALARDLPAQAIAQPGQPKSITARVPIARFVEAGELFDVPLSFIVKDSLGTPVGGLQVTVLPTAGEVHLQGAEETTDQAGVVSFPSLQVLGVAGEFAVIVVAGEAQTETYRLQLHPGPPRVLRIIAQPSARTVTDSLLPRSLRVRVLDYSGNGLPRKEVQVRLIFEPSPGDSIRLAKEDKQRRDPKNQKKRWCDPRKADLIGPLVRKTDDNGEASFDSLGISGCPGTFALEAAVHRSVNEIVSDTSTTIDYDADVSLNRNYIAISAIKSIAGQIPDDEFFDIRFRFRLGSRISVVATSDVALTARNDTGAVRSSQKRLTEASLSVNHSIHTRADSRNGVPERDFFAGAVIKIFNTAPYAGVQLGAIELAGSPFQGSTLTLGGVASLYSTPYVVDGTTIRPRFFNLLADFLIRSESIDFFKSLNIRGSVLLPVGRAEPLSSRIGIAVPVGTLHLF